MIVLTTQPILFTQVVINNLASNQQSYYIMIRTKYSG